MTTKIENPPLPLPAQFPGPSAHSAVVTFLTLLTFLTFSAFAQLTPGFQSTNLYQRASVRFATAHFFKPLAPKVEDVTYKLAPLLLQEVKNEKGETNGAGGGLFGRLTLSSPGLAAVDAAQPAIYVAQDTVLLNGRLHPRLSYLWFYSLEPLRTPGAALPFQGVRLTLNSAGEPVIWEVLAEPSGAELLFVAQSLEVAAQAQFGKPLPGRRYAIERATNEAPQAVVARVIDDGPLPMGPILYVSAGTRAVSTLICRCMPAQAKQLQATTTYELKPLQGSDELLTRARVQAQFQTPFWPGELPPTNRLEQCLRLPESF